MTTTQTTTPRSGTLTEEEVEALARAATAALEPLTTQEKPNNRARNKYAPVLERMRDIVLALRAKRYSWRDIAKSLKTSGVHVSAEYLRRTFDPGEGAAPAATAAPAHGRKKAPARAGASRLARGAAAASAPAAANGSASSPARRTAATPPAAAPTNTTPPKAPHAGARRQEV